MSVLAVASKLESYLMCLVQLHTLLLPLERLLRFFLIWRLHDVNLKVNSYKYRFLIIIIKF